MEWDSCPQSLQNGTGLVAVQVEADEDDLDAALQQIRQAEEDERLAKQLHKQLNAEAALLSPSETADQLLAKRLQVWYLCKCDPCCQNSASLVTQQYPGCMLLENARMRRISITLGILSFAA